MTTDEHDEILRILAEQRHTLLITIRGIGDDAAARQTTSSEYCLGSLIKHLTQVERHWTQIIAQTGTEHEHEAWDPQRQPLTELVKDYEAAAAELTAVVAAVPDLGQPCPLPETPWFKPGAAWSARRILLHLIRETSQHCGHADIIREELDGANTTSQLLADVQGEKLVT